MRTKCNSQLVFTRQIVINFSNYQVVNLAKSGPAILDNVSSQKHQEYPQIFISIINSLSTSEGDDVKACHSHAGLTPVLIMGYAISHNKLCVTKALTHPTTIVVQQASETLSVNNRMTSSTSSLSISKGRVGGKTKVATRSPKISQRG